VVDVVVTGPDGQPVRDLTAADFAVEEEGKPQAIASFEAVDLDDVSYEVSEPPAISSNEGRRAEVRRSFVLVFDDLNLTPGGALKARHQLQEFARTIFRPGDLVTVVPTSGGGAWTVRMPEGGPDLVRALNRFQGRRPTDSSPDRISDYEAMLIHVYRDEEATRLVERRLGEAGLTVGALGENRLSAQSLGILDRAADVYAQARERTRLTLVALARILRSLGAAGGRKSVVLVSEGFIHDTDLDEFGTVLSASWAANANLYFLSARGLEGLGSAIGVERQGPTTMADDAERTAQTLDISASRRYAGYEADGANSLAVDSGGFAVRTNHLSKGLQRIVRESRAYYLLGYVPPDPRRDGKFRKIHVEVKRPGVSLRARKGYYAPSGDPKAATPGPADPALRAALESPYESLAIPLRMTAYLLGPAGEDRVQVVLAAEADPAALGFEEKGGRFADALQSVFQVSARDSEPVYSKERQLDLDLAPPVRERMARTWVPVAGSFELPPGSYQATLLVRDQGSGRVGTVRHPFEVPAAGGFRVSTPILTDTFMGGADGQPAPVPLARRRFAPGIELTCVFDVFGARVNPATGQPQVALRYGVRRADGPEATLHALGVAPDAEGRLTQKIKVPLRGVPPGAYEIVLKVDDELAGESVERREVFEIAAPAMPGPATGEGAPGV